MAMAEPWHPAESVFTAVHPGYGRSVRTVYDTVCKPLLS